MKNILITLTLSLMMVGCISIPEAAFRPPVDKQFERYVAIRSDIQRQVDAGTLNPERAFEMDQQAYNQYLTYKQNRENKMLI